MNCLVVVELLLECLCFGFLQVILSVMVISRMVEAMHPESSSLPDSWMKIMPSSPTPNKSKGYHIARICTSRLYHSYVRRRASWYQKWRLQKIAVRTSPFGIVVTRVLNSTKPPSFERIECKRTVGTDLYRCSCTTSSAKRSTSWRKIPRGCRQIVDFC